MVKFCFLGGRKCKATQLRSVAASLRPLSFTEPDLRRFSPWFYRWFTAAEVPRTAVFHDRLMPFTWSRRKRRQQRPRRS